MLNARAVALKPARIYFEPNFSRKSKRHRKFLLFSILILIFNNNSLALDKIRLCIVLDRGEQMVLLHILEDQE